MSRGLQSQQLKLEAGSGYQAYAQKADQALCFCACKRGLGKPERGKTEVWENFMLRGVCARAAACFRYGEALLGCVVFAAAEKIRFENASKPKHVKKKNSFLICISVPCPPSRKPAHPALLMLLIGRRVRRRGVLVDWDVS